MKGIVLNYFPMTMTMWVESSHSDSQELNLIEDPPRTDFSNFLGKAEITRLMNHDNYSFFSWSRTAIIAIWEQLKTTLIIDKPVITNCQ